MTLVIGWEHKEKVYLAGDRFVGDSHYYDISDRPKIWTVSTKLNGEDLNVTVGGAGSYRVDHVLQNKLTNSEFSTKHESIDDWVTKDFVLEISDAFKEDDISISKHEEGPTLLGCSEFLLVVKGRLYAFLSDLAIHKSGRSFQAVGAGSFAAMGAWQVVKKNKKSPEKKMMQVMEAAAEVSPQVKPPFDIICVY